VDVDHREARLGFSNDVLRLVIGSALSVLLLAGGVYWLQSLPVGSPRQEAGTAVQVRLLTSEEPTPFPLAAAGTASISSISEKDNDNGHQPEPEHDEAIAEPQPAPLPLKSKKGAPSRFTQRLAQSAASELAMKFQQTLLRHIARFQRYPEQARARGSQGTVVVVFLLRRDGSVLNAWIQSTSGETLLDREAIATIHRAEPLPSIPGELPDQMRVLLPVDFTLP
jgi:periplasmic protein TonB